MQNTGYRLRIRRAGGFTLAEILITLVIIGFIGALGIPMLGQTKLKHPTEVKARHGTMECFYDGSTLYQYEANNGENRMGELTVATDACYFSAPAANIFVVQAVGTGGDGAVGSGTASYSPTTGSEGGSISTGPAFLSDITSEDTPDWVREGWNQAMATQSNWPEYTLVSPVGGSGSGVCEYRRYNTPGCLEACYVDVEVEKTCPSSCRFELEAVGGRSADGGKLKVKVPLEYSVDGTQDNVQFSTGILETKISFNGGKYVSLKVSDSGKSATNNGYGVATDGEKGEEYNDSYVDMAGNIIPVGSLSKGNAGQEGGTGCGNVAGKSAKRGAITQGSPSSISYSSSVLAVNARYGVAGSAGQSSMKLIEQIPEGTRLKMIPSKDTSQNSYVYMENEDGGWDLLMAVGSGSDGHMTSGFFTIEQSDLPFPASYYPESFRPQTAEVSIASGQGYRSELVSRGISPGMGGGGTHPLITYVSGTSTHTIGGVAVGTAPLTPVSGGGSCIGLASHGGVCGYPNNPGTQGAVIVSW